MSGAASGLQQNWEEGTENSHTPLPTPTGIAVPIVNIPHQTGPFVIVDNIYIDTS
jgi:hypothetical protein